MLEIPADVQVDVGPPSAAEKDAVYMLGRQVDVRTRDVVYLLRLHSRTRQGWEVQRSFAELIDFNDSLKSRFTTVPAFPRKRHITHLFKYNEKSDYWDAIGNELQSYFNELLSQESFRRDLEVQKFLQPAAEDPAPPLLVSLTEPVKLPKGDYEYTISVSNEHLKTLRLAWTMSKLHSDLAEFDEMLRRLFPQKELPEFPRKRHGSQYLRYGSEQEWYRVQRGQIEDYLNQILASEELVEEQCVRQFLDISETKLRIARRSCGIAQRRSSDADSSSPSTAASQSPSGDQVAPRDAGSGVSMQHLLAPNSQQAASGRSELGDNEERPCARACRCCRPCGSEVGLRTRIALCCERLRDTFGRSDRRA